MSTATETAPPATDTPPAATAPSVRARSGATRFLTSPMAVVSLVLLAAFVVVAVVGPTVWGDAASATRPDAVLLPASGDHWFGTDALGRDIFARVMVATRLSLVMALSATAAGAVAGVLLGGLPVAFGARVQRAASAVITTWLAFPVLLVAMLVVILLDAGTVTAVIALAVTMTPSFARLTQTLAARVGGSEYLAAARLLGISRTRQLTRYVVPNIAEPVIVNVTLSIGGGLLALSSLSFLGVGVQPPDFDWGRLLSDGFDQVYTSSAAALGPGAVIILAGLTFGMLGESMAAHLRGGRTRSVGRGGPGALAVAPMPVALAEPVVGALLEVRGLRVTFPGPHGPRAVVRGVDLVLMPGEIVGVVGESGSGKSVTMTAIAGLADPTAHVHADRMLLRGEDLLALSPRDRSAALRAIGMVFQDSLTALNPALRVGTQLAEVPRAARVAGTARPSRRAAHQTAVAALGAVQITDPERRARQFPHEFSGGMRQRALIAMAQMSGPPLLVADEPTTALDVTVQRQVLTLLRRQCAENGQTAVVVSHDIAVLGELCERLVVMYQGEVVDAFPTADLRTPERLAHPYSRALVRALPDLSTDVTQPLATVEALLVAPGSGPEDRPEDRPEEEVA
ncbi:dipeptide/oligopeptide/nickel ABC transporter permease/ATP-binding protein [Cellulomonas soli]|uniref:Peptide ABC transporter ATP-binding protein n=1 Tax=Cellulomonas soli TaxID=931535 RepID=A0A512PDI3_9CELL|nr:dipeptide/oligopeptide/nickel ABC transporter permease/ATP-binding protein [Cellulomonas soli]NYI60077.1 ABC-type dipeptide/oligopeptide/nickel transport system ATPase component/ABC-type dipeptide/oligopeptide/nickel transport system permease subunit [Cellulomonas soli]GEP69269.1 peptide ABC transporter ATP-binding protein [Cellulomonas soli]